MMARWSDALIGAVVLCIALVFVIFSYRFVDQQDYRETYRLNADFDRVDGIAVGSEVRIGGIKIGQVESLQLLPNSYRARVNISLRSDVHLPEDSSAEVIGDGLLGAKFVAITPGAENSMLKDGGTILYTQSSVNLETLIGQMIFSRDQHASGTKAPPEAVPH